MLCCLIALNMTASAIDYAPMLIGGVLALALGGFIYAVYFQIIYTTGNGYEDAPSFPDFSNAFDNMLVPFLKVFLITLLCFLPAGIYTALAGANANKSITLALILIGHCYFPMGMMIAALDEVGKALNPAIVLQGIRAAGSTYFIMAGAIFGLYTLESIIENSFTGSWIVTGIVTSYGLMFSARLIGSVYKEKILPLQA
jgi:hypothetical protein